MAITVTATPNSITEGGIITLRAEPPEEGGEFTYLWRVSAGSLLEQGPAADTPEVNWDTTNLRPGMYRASVQVTRGSNGEAFDDSGEVEVIVSPRPLSRDDILPVTMRRTENAPTADLPLWVVIR